MDEVTRQNLLSRSSAGLGRGESGWDNAFVNESEDSFLITSSSTSFVTETLPLADSSSSGLTIAIVAISVLITIGLLFGIAIFVDYRQQKVLDQQKCIVKKRRSFGWRLPHCRRVTQPTAIVEDAEDISRTRPPLEFVNETV